MVFAAVNAAARVIELRGFYVQLFAAVDVAAVVIELRGFDVPVFFGGQHAAAVVDVAGDIQGEAAPAGDLSLTVIQLRGIDDDFLVAADVAAFVRKLRRVYGDTGFAGQFAIVIQLGGINGGFA